MTFESVDAERDYWREVAQKLGAEYHLLKTGVARVLVPLIRTHGEKCETENRKCCAVKEAEQFLEKLT